MSLPRPVSEAFLQFGVPADTIAWMDDLYRHLGPGVVDALAELVEERGLRPVELRPQDCDAIRPRLGERYLREHHAGWADGGSCAAFYCDRNVEGAARGLVTALGDVGTGSTPFAARVADAVRRETGPDQTPPRGLLLLSHNAHRGGQEGTFAFDLVPNDIEDAIALNHAIGQQHTVPGSIGEASGRALVDPPAAILWEVQPNVYKPAGERNRAAGPAYRRYRAWPMVTATAALLWLRERGDQVFVLRGEALADAHQVNPDKPVPEEIRRLHDRTLERAASAVGGALAACAPGGVPEVLARLAKVNLPSAIEERGLAALVRELVPFASR